MDVSECMRNHSVISCFEEKIIFFVAVVSINQVNLNNSSFAWILISRRSVHRAGTRFFRRGIDKNVITKICSAVEWRSINVFLVIFKLQGNCANFVETEQIVEYSNDRVSFVQIRGSIPLYWSQYPNLKYKPKLSIEMSREHVAAATQHLDANIKLYGRQILVNLIDHHGGEGSLEKSFAELINVIGNQNVRYESFDFHAECRKMQWHRLNILIDRLAHEQEEFGLFHQRGDGVVLSQQTGVFRTNCIDCLDRTNVVQSMLAHRSLNQVLIKLGILDFGQRLESATSFETLYKNVWADNADLISIQYSGTGALKTDFTRTGKRTIQGALQDGINSMTRYFKNNLSDGFRQVNFTYEFESLAID